MARSGQELYPPPPLFFKHSLICNQWTTPRWGFNLLTTGISFYIPEHASEFVELILQIITHFQAANLYGYWNAYKADTQAETSLFKHICIFYILLRGDCQKEKYSNPISPIRLYSPILTHSTLLITLLHNPYCAGRPFPSLHNPQKHRIATQNFYWEDKGLPLSEKPIS